MMGNESSILWSSVYSDIKRTHDAAYLVIDQAIILEEQEKPSEAVDKYKQGISLIDQALSIQIECPENPDFTWKKACVMIQKMKKTRVEVLTRINCIQVVPDFVAPMPPPSYEKAMSTSSDGSLKLTYSALASALDNSGPAEIIYTLDNVKLYFIMPDERVLSLSEPLTLKIGIIQGIIEGQVSTFLEVGEWIYPLVPGVSSCIYSEYGAFIFPDIQSDIPGSSIGIIVPNEAVAEIFILLEDILQRVIGERPPSVEYEIDRRKRSEGVSGTISKGIVQGAYYLSQGLIKGTQNLGELLNYGTPKLLQHVQPAPEDKPIPTTVQKGFEIARDVTSTAANITGYVATKVGTATMALGRFLAPHIQRQGTQLLINEFKMSPKDASEKIAGVLTVAAGAVEGFSTVYTGLETSAKILGNNLTNNTVKIVEHKYGQPSGLLAGNTLYTIGNIAAVSHNINYITPKGIAKRAVKQTGTAMVADLRNDLKPQPIVTDLTGSNLYPSISNDPGPSTSGVSVSSDIIPSKK